jgi:Maf1 regulator
MAQDRVPRQRRVVLCCCARFLAVADSATGSGWLLPAGEDGNIWSFNFFLYNRKLKRMLYFSCRGVSKAAGHSNEVSADYGYSSDEDGELWQLEL